MTVNGQNRFPEYQSVDEVGFSHEAENTIRTFLSDNTPESECSPDETDNSTRHRFFLDRQIHRDPAAVKGVCLLLLENDQHNFTESQVEGQIGQHFFRPAVKHMRDQEHYFHRFRYSKRFMKVELHHNGSLNKPGVRLQPRASARMENASAPASVFLRSSYGLG